MTSALIKSIPSTIFFGEISRRWKCTLLRHVYAAVVLCSTVVGTAAASEVMVYQEYAKRIDSARTVSALKSGLFGESVSLYNGATTFSTTDIDLPGQSGLPVSLGRNFQIDTADSTERRGGFGLWDLDVPYIHGVFADDWNTSGGGHMRCTQFGIPLHSGVFDPKDFWSGTKLHLPGSGDHDILAIANSNGLHPKMKAPDDGRIYRLGTKDFHRIRCKPTTANGYPGEAFVVIDASGVTYTLDIGMHHGAGSVIKYASDHGNAQLGRTHVYMMVSRVEDRFGNWVNYQWSGKKLTSITASDGRAIVLNWDGGRNILSATANGRVWSYTYGQYGNLDRVTLPDGTFWRYQGAGVAQPTYITPDISLTGPDCAEPPEAYDGAHITIVHPSGAVGDFEFSLIRHRRSGIPKSACTPYAWTYLFGFNPIALHAMAIPDYFDVHSLVKKTLSGPGMSPQVWTYVYDIVAVGRTPLQTGPAVSCPGTHCQDVKSVWVIQPDGTEEEYRFGVIWHGNDGRLLAKYTRKPAPDRRVVRAEFYDYMSANDAATSAFPEVYGYSFSADDSVAIKIRPVIKTTVLQDGDIAPPVYWTPELPPPPPPPCTHCPPPPPPVCDPATGTCETPTAIPVVSLDLLNLYAGDVQTDNVQSAFSAVTSSASTLSTTQYILETDSFDAFARPVSVTQSNSLGQTKTNITEYHDDLTKWVIGQLKRQYNVQTGMVMSQTDYNAQALPWKTYSFGKLQSTLNYYADGTLASFTDGRNQTITLSNWKRGIPQLIQHPATPEAPSGATESAVVDNNGWITSATNEIGAKTCYTYDPMGRMASILYPSETQAGVCDASRWSPVSLSFVQVNSDEHVLPAGHWRASRYEGNKHVNTYYDAMWRPVLEEALDASNIAGTLSQVVKKYDTSGRLSFQSYPTTNVGNYWDVTQGTRSFYDALDRVTRVEQDSEHGVLATTTDYWPNLQTRVVNPRGQATVTAFMAWDQPTYDLPIASVQPEGKVIEIARHPQFGWPLQLKQRSADNTLQQTRHYVYDGNAQLCKTIEPETGATVTGYDAANNPLWSASGLIGGSYASTSDCSYVAANTSGRVVNRTYDARNRIATLSFPDGLGNQFWAYEKDSLPTSITTYNGANNTVPVVNYYTYNKRRLLVGESSHQPGWYTWGLAYEYDSIGNLRWQSYPDSLTLDYAPNALGQPTQVRDQFNTAYASGAQYYPNGALKQFTYGNGIAHSMLQNARQLPARVSSSGGVSDFGYSYDNNANIVSIWDYARDTGSGFYGRWMTYDGLDRLTAAGSCNFGGDCWHRFSYDALDNLKSWKLGGVKDYADYVYEAQTNRLTSIRNTAGATVLGISYDAQGNLQNKNGQTYEFDHGNRLRGVTGKEYYRYDGLGRRVLNWRNTDNTATLSQYSQSGQLMYQEESAKPASTHIYLGGSLIATRENTWGVGIAIKYQHTDALGSPVAVTNQAGAVIERNDYEPYGAIIGKPNKSGIGYTGHMMDGATGLTYMQQRYYDQSLGRFLSVDPVTADPNTGAMFNRYRYAANNPYRFIDPDGRCDKPTGSHICSGGGGSSGPSGLPVPVYGQGPPVPKHGAPSAAQPERSLSDKAQRFVGGAGDMLVDKALPALGPPEAFAAGGAKLLGGGLLAFRLGKAGEDSVRAMYSIGGKQLIYINGRVRIPDGVNRGISTLSEIKNASYQAYTRQLRDYVDFAKSNGLQFNLYVRPGAQLSAPLEAAIRSGDITLKAIP